MSACRGLVIGVLLSLAGCVEGALVLGPVDAGVGAPDADGSSAADASSDAAWVDAWRADGDGPPGARDVASGVAHSCAVVDGALACWGRGADGALGVGPTGDRAGPVRVGGADDWTSIAAGDEVTCGLRAGAGLLCWGEGDHGQLGLGDREPRGVPTAVALPGRPRALRLTRRFGCAIVDDGSLVCWGANAEGQLGRADVYPGTDGLSPEPVASSMRFRDAAVGQGHACAIATDGSLWCWGRNSDGQLGVGSGAPDQLRAPARVGDRTDWARVVCGQGHTCAIREEGTLWCWGEDFAGQVGISLGARFDEPTQVGSAASWTDLTTSVFHTCGLQRDGSLWCWGRNVEGQLGTGDNEERTSPARVDEGRDWARVSAGLFHTCAQRTDGTVLCTGENGEGRLGVGDLARRDAFAPVVEVVVE